MNAMENKPSKGDTRTAQQETEGGRVPRTPNEHDTSADSQKGRQPGNNEVGKAAHQDATNGTQDTDKGPVMDKVYDKVQQGT